MRRVLYSMYVYVCVECVCAVLNECRCVFMCECMCACVSASVRVGGCGGGRHTPKSHAMPAYSASGVRGAVVGGFVML